MIIVLRQMKFVYFENRDSGDQDEVKMRGPKKETGHSILFLVCLIPLQSSLICNVFMDVMGNVHS